MDAHETSIFTAVFIASIVIAVIFTYFIIIIIQNQRRSKALYKSKILAEITTLEKERARIASDLHDELGPYLSAAKLRINSLDVTTEEDSENLHKINEHIDIIIQRMREISADLLPNTLVRKGLVYGVLEFIDNIPKPAELKIQFDAAADVAYSPDLHIHLYRIVQEIIHNTIKHSKANLLKIELKKSRNMVVLLTEDNGVGFDYNVISREKQGLGLRNLLSRVEIMGGEMFIESHPDKGTRYTFEIPFRDHN